MVCMVTAGGAIWRGEATTFTHLPSSAASVAVMATMDLTSKELSSRKKRGAPAEVHAPALGSLISTRRSTSLTTSLLDMSSSCRSTHFTSLVPASSGVAKGTQPTGDGTD